MTQRQFYISTFVLATITIISCIVAWTYNKSYETQARINAQTEVEKTIIEQDKKTERAKEYMNMFPWYKGGENKEEEENNEN